MAEENNEISKCTREGLRLVHRDISDMDRRLGEIFAYLHQAGTPMRQTAQLVSSPRDLRRMCDVVLASENQMLPLGERIVRRQSGGSVSHQFLCPCNGQQKLKREQKCWGPLILETEHETTYRHEPECPIPRIGRARHQREWTVKFLMPSILNILNNAIRISFSLKVGAGGFGFSQNLTYIATVSERSSPSFRLINATRMAVYALTTSRMEILARSCLRRLLVCYADGRASPTDVNESGQSILDMLAWQRVVRRFRSDHVLYANYETKRSKGLVLPKQTISLESSD